MRRIRTTIAAVFAWIAARLAPASTAIVEEPPATSHPVMTDEEVAEYRAACEVIAEAGQHVGMSLDALAARLTQTCVWREYGAQMYGRASLRRMVSRQLPYHHPNMTKVRRLGEAAREFLAGLQGPAREEDRQSDAKPPQRPAYAAAVDAVTGALQAMGLVRESGAAHKGAYRLVAYLITRTWAWRATGREPYSTDTLAHLRDTDNGLAPEGLQALCRAAAEVKAWASPLKRGLEVREMAVAGVRALEAACANRTEAIDRLIATSAYRASGFKRPLDGRWALYRAGADRVGSVTWHWLLLAAKQALRAKRRLDDADRQKGGTQGATG